MAKPKIGAIRTEKPSALSAFMPKENATPAPATRSENPAPVGRPKSLPEGTRSVTFRMSDSAHQALKALAVQERTTTKAIILAGLADQFSRHGLSVKVE